MRRPSVAVRVYVSDDHPLYRDALARTIGGRPDFDLVGASSEGRTALAEIKRLSPDVAVLDRRMPGLDGAALVQAIKRESPTTRIVMVAPDEDGEHAYQALAAGADAYLVKTADSEEICRTVAAVARGQTRLGAGDSIELAARDSEPLSRPPDPGSPPASTRSWR